MQPRHQGIEGLEGRLPIGAAVTVGVKGPSGAPTNTDRFFFVLPHDVKDGKHSIRPLHPSFASFNGAEPAKRQMLRGNLIHADRSECFSYNLRAQVLAPLDKWPAHPQKRPACTGDGNVATRYYGETGADDFREIECPNELCEFRQGAKKLCKPFAQLLFRPRWSEGSTLPTPLTKLTTGSWYSTAVLLGFFDYIAAQAKHLGMESYSLFGLPFTLTLTRKTKPQEGQAFPVLAISPECDLIQFFLAQTESRSRLAAGNPALALPAVALTDPEMNDPEVLASDLAAITPTEPITKPRNAPNDGLDPIEAEVIDGPSVPPFVARVLHAAESRGIAAEAIESIIGGKLEDAPASAELEILKKIAEYRPSKSR